MFITLYTHTRFTKGILTYICFSHIFIYAFSYAHLPMTASNMWCIEKRAHHPKGERRYAKKGSLRKGTYNIKTKII